MNTALTLINLAGAVALLIWGVHMVQTGVNRAFGPHLRRALSYASATASRHLPPAWASLQSCKAARPPA
jgi:phosphate:Na+ symporter